MFESLVLMLQEQVYLLPVAVSCVWAVSGSSQGSPVVVEVPSRVHLMLLAEQE